MFFILLLLQGATTITDIEIMKKMMESAACPLYAVSHAVAFPVLGDT